jgi:hypothetical protein
LLLPTSEHGYVFFVLVKEDAVVCANEEVKKVM